MGFELMYRDSGNTMHFSFFKEQFLLTSQKIKISKDIAQKRKKVFSLKVASWIVSKTLNMFCNEN